VLPRRLHSIVCTLLFLTVAQTLVSAAPRLVSALSPANAQPLPSETDRLLATGKLWITVKLFHPALAHRTGLNWDQALIDALPKIRSAQTPAEYEAAVRALMHTLESNTPLGPSAGQRIRIHHGFTPETGNPSESPFYSAFLYKPTNTPEEITVPMGAFAIKVPLSEPASTGPPIPSPLTARSQLDTYPSTELRILAAYKIWGVLRYFFAYRDLIDEDWDALFAQFLPRMVAAKDDLEYNLAIAEWLTHAADTFTAAQSYTLTQYFGEAPVGLRVFIVEKHVTITEILDPEAVKAGVKIGDVVKTVDGETLVNRFKRQELYLPASTPQRLGFEVVNRILNGPDDSNAVLTLEDPAGHRKDVTLKRSKRFIEPLAAESPSESTKLLRGDIGYADLRRLKRTEVDAMFEKFRNARAIIFDMRGVPADDSIRAIAPRLASEPDVPAAIVTGPVAAVPDLPKGSIDSPSSSYFFIETIGNSPQWKFKGRTMMLVDERTIGPGEEAGLFLEAANKTEFAGTPTAGAHSVLSNFTVPGGVSITFSGQDIRHANGGKLQRLGLQPNLNAEPTLNGIRSGKDEVLEKALDYLSPKPPASPKKLPSRA